MPHNLGKVVRCESRVTTRLRFVRKSTEISGSPTRVEILEVSVSQRTFVTNAPIDLNALNGVSITKDMASGVDSPHMTEELFVANLT